MAVPFLIDGPAVQHVGLLVETDGRDSTRLYSDTAAHLTQRDAL